MLGSLQYSARPSPLAMSEMHPEEGRVDAPLLPAICCSTRTRSGAWRGPFNRSGTPIPVEVGGRVSVAKGTLEHSARVRVSLQPPGQAASRSQFSKVDSSSMLD